MEKSLGSPELKEYHGNCHCGLFRFRLNIAPLTILWTCNCSICSRNGYLWIHPVAEKQFIIDAGKEKSLHSYEFAMRGTKHLFCTECGSSIMARRRDAPPDQSLRINARMLEDIDISRLEVRSFSGADIGTKYEPIRNLNENKAEDDQNWLYKGNCHCGSFQFLLRIPKLTKARVCNCSICTRNGYMWIGPVGPESMVIATGDGKLSSYQFGNKTMTHSFCPKCGTSIMGKLHSQPADKALGINARVLKDVDLKSLEIIKFQGNTLGPEYDPPASYPGMELDEKDKGLAIYNGNCHCGAVTYTVKTKPLTETKVMSCNCSLCSRNGDLFIYPPKSAVKVSGGENLTGYGFLSEKCLHSFCRKCGVSVLVKNIAEEDEDMPINVRTIQGVDLGGLVYQEYDGAANDPQYAL